MTHPVLKQCRIVDKMINECEIVGGMIIGRRN
jgi:hypothetical protein